MKDTMEQRTTFDPYSPKRNEMPPPTQHSLLDNENVVLLHSNKVLEMEEFEDESLSLSPEPMTSKSNFEQPIVTNSGLLLTHRRSSPALQSPHSSIGRPSPTNHDYDDREQLKRRSNGAHPAVAATTSPAYVSPPLQRTRLRERFEVENPWSAHSGNDSFVFQAQKLFSYARVWVLLSSMVLVLGTVILLHHAQAGSDNIVDQSELVLAGNNEFSANSNNRVVNIGNQNYANSNSEATARGVFPDGEEVVLLPLDPSKLNDHQGSPLQRRLYQNWQKKMTILRQVFQSWIEQHNKNYLSDEEVEFRFRIWAENHIRIQEKNERHGPCRKTKQPVFGSNHFQDLTTEEFENSYLNAQHTPVSKKLRKRRLSSGTLGPHLPALRHPDIHQRYLKMTGGERTNDQNEETNQRERKLSRRYNCSWWDVSCLLRYITEKYFYGFYGIGGTMEPAYDSSTYPSAVDWRDMGAITDVRAQDDCGACWAITAVENVESAYYLSYGTLLDLAETEVIMCTEDCEMCYGGWPEDAFEHIMESGGVPLESDLPYDGSFLLTMTMAKAGESAELSEEDVDSYISQTCPAGSHDSNNDGNGYNFARYGKIAGYGYATDKCTCYTDGSGCDCENQNEGLAVANVATYGPAVVCVDAAEWKDYSGGIISSESGCSSAFLDVNHCVQVVGYAFDSDDDEDQNGNGSKSGSGSGSSDNQQRNGYWIVRNQWSEYWGMYGYAYVNMGENTCGILNDMIQVYNKK